MWRQTQTLRRVTHSIRLRESSAAFDCGWPPPRHHQTAIQTLPTTLGVDSQTLIRLDKLRKQRNLAEYTGDLIPESAVTECLSQARSLHAATLNWLKANKADLL